jgi:hypothetical protein
MIYIFVWGPALAYLLPFLGFSHFVDCPFRFFSITSNHSTEFCSTLENLVKLAPPSSAVTDTPNSSRIHNLLKTTLFQTILVTHFHHLEKDDDQDETDPDPDRSTFAPAVPDHFDQCSEDDNRGGNGEDESSDDDEEESFDPPWPTEHEAFCALPLVQEHVLLEIATGLNSSGNIVKPMELPKGKVKVVLPGSLRERGEFCLVDVAFMKDPYQHNAAPDYRWRVRKTRFQTLNDYL